MPKSATQKRARRQQDRAEVTRQNLIDAAIGEFSERGFDGVRVRDIEVRAEVPRSLLNYHFGSKEDIWKAAASHLATKMRAYGDARREIMQDLSPHERVAYTIRSYVRFAAYNPEFSRLMLQEGKHDSWRMHWLVDNFLRPAMRQLQEQLKTDINLDEGEFVHWYYLFAAGGAAIFSMAPEAKQLFDVDVHDKALISRHANIMVEFLLSRRSD